jgi:hypothetical protein
LLCLSLTSCGSSKARAKVKGKVKYFDKYLTAGTVAFTNAAGQVGSGNIDFEGNYEVANAPIGEVTITVTVPKMSSGPVKGGPPKPPPGVPEMRPPDGSVAGGKESSMIDPSKIVQIPNKYAETKTSGLKYTVEKGEQTHDITLTP